MAGKRVLIFGATGLVGGELVRLLLADDTYATVVTVGRRKMDLSHIKLQQEVVDFDQLDQYTDIFKGDAVFCCLGTTMKKAGSEAAFRKIDYEIPMQIGQLAKAAGIPKYLIVTAMGADTKSYFFYNRVKGEIERDLAGLNFEQLSILRPGLLLGNRPESRWGESMAQMVMQTFSPILPLTFRPISGKTVARALMALEKSTPQQSIFHSGELQKLGQA